MAGIYTDIWRIVKPQPAKREYVMANPDDYKLYNNFSWYTKIMKGATSRFTKYQTYKGMDNDVFVARALDTIAEQATSIDSVTNLPFEITYQNEVDKEIPEVITETVRAALRHWCGDIQQLNKKLFDIVRVTIKYGDCFFRKVSDHKMWEYIDPGEVIGISYVKDEQRSDFYQIRTHDGGKTGTHNDMELVPAKGIVHFSLTSGMGENGPFGESVLFPVIKAYRHLSLLEDAVIIYRIVRAPERRVFMIDVGNMVPQRAKAYLDAIKNEIRQKRVPNEAGGQERVDSAYNPQSMTEDFFFAQTAEGRGSKVDTLPGGENLGEISDLNYFQNRFLQGLRIPSSYMRGSKDDGALIQDGKVGVAYMEEQIFADYIGRIQGKLNDTFDEQFKAYLASAGIKIDPSLFKIRLNDPQNFKDYKQAEVDEKLISNFSNLKDVKFIAKRTLLTQYLGWTEDQIQANEARLKQENGIPDGGIGRRLDELRMMYDDAWLEKHGGAEIKVDEDYENYEDLTAKTGSEAEETPEGEDKPKDGEDAGKEGEDTGGMGEDDATTSTDPDNPPPAEEGGDKGGGEEKDAVASIGSDLK